MLLTGIGSAAASPAAHAPFAARQARIHVIAKALDMESDVVFHDGFDAGSASCAADRDADRLADCAETGTGIFIDATDTGTSADASDTDADGLLDGDEVLGTADGLDLPALGAHPLRRDILIEYDWFDDALECAEHSHAPDAEALERVRRLFAEAPVANPDGSSGITVLQDAGQFGGGNRVDGHDPVLPGTFDTTYDAIKTANFDARRRGYFHYVLMPHRYAAGSTSSGFAEIVGDDAIVSLHCYAGNAAYVANTIVHELGHNLGLLHGGFEECNGKPNYSSLMNYRYQFAGVDSACTGNGTAASADFSSGASGALDENRLDETQGSCDAQPIDWNFDGVLEADVVYDINGAHGLQCGGELTTLLDFDDWSNVTFLGLLDEAGVLKSVQSEVACDGVSSPRM